LSSAEFYDDYADRQVRVGINDRHRAIGQWLKRFGLEPGMEVLELGCGVGTVTELIAEVLTDTGKLLAVDFSPTSIEAARRRLGAHRNVELQAGDIVELELDRTFDVVVLADVIEHIPLEQHLKLFANVRRWLRDTGWVLVHIPNPFFLEWCRRHRPDLLQELDQPIFTESLVASTQPNDLYVRYLNTYSIWVPEGDYQVILLRPRLGDAEFHLPAGPSLREKLAHLARRMLSL
jgi:trans-aconitate 2-methyltransferase